MSLGPPRSAWVVGIAVASLACATAVQARRGYCEPCTDAWAAECCDHDRADARDSDAQHTDGYSHVAPSDDGHCACSSVDCGPVPTNLVAIASHDIIPDVAVWATRTTPRATVAHYPPHQQEVARGPPKRTIVLLR